MTEVILNDECVHCKDKECHDGEHFCNQAMKENSFYKNAKLYKGIEVIKRPTYEELEKENAELKSIADFQQSGNMSRYFELKRQSEQLTIAKKIMKKLLDTAMGWWDRGIVKNEAEQFLSEVEK